MASYLRRTVLGWPLAGLAGCSRRRVAKGFAGIAFVANAAGEAVAAVDLTALAVVRHIRVEGNPTQVAAHPVRPSVYAYAPGAGTLSDIDTDKLGVRGKVRVAAGDGTLHLQPGGDRAWVLSRASRELTIVATDRLAVHRRPQLPALGVDLDFAPARSPMPAGTAAVSLGETGEIALLRGDDGTLLRTIKIGGSLGAVRFRQPDGRYLLIADKAEREIVVWDLARQRLAVRLPLAVRPDRCAMKPDGGQFFVAGDGMDAVVTVYPYQTEVGSITLAGKAPGYLVASDKPDYLFVANPDSNDVTVINVADQKVLAVAAVGREPCFIAVTPNNEYALVLNRQSGDVAVLHIGSMTSRRSKSIPLLTMIPVGSEPVSAVIRAV